MRIRRATPQKPLTEEQKARAIEAQKHVQELNGWPLTANQVYQNYPSVAPTMSSRFQDNMRKNPFMRNRMTFEEKYWVVQNMQHEGTVIEDSALETINTPEDTVIPPSLEEDANQASPLPPGVQNASDMDDFDAFIKEQENKKLQVDLPEVDNIDNYRETLQQMDVKDLKEEYVARGWERDISHNNNKKNLINLIIELIENGSSQEETGWATAW